jgi:hypothetical protein
MIQVDNTTKDVCVSHAAVQEVVKVTEIVPRMRRYKELVTGLYKEGGAASLVRGSGITLVRDGVASFFYFSTYEFLKKYWTKPVPCICTCIPTLYMYMYPCRRDNAQSSLITQKIL